MKKLKTNEDKLNSVLLVVILATMLLGHIVTFGGYRVMGVVITLQRLMVLITAFVILYRIFYKKQQLIVHKNQKLIIFIFILWMIIGLILLILNPLSSMSKGILELSNIAIGGLFILLLIARINQENDVHILYTTLKIIGIFFIALAIFELFTRYHLPTSRLKVGSKFMAATGIFYNENDFSTALALLTPFYLINRKNSIVNKLSGAFLLLLTFWLIYKNDSWIVLVFLFIGLILQQWINGRQKFVMISLATLLLTVIFYRLFTGSGFSVLDAQISSMKVGSGSLYNRLVTYKNSFLIAKDTYFLGLGPNGFASFIVHNKMDGLVNPHNLWLEILSQYGIIIFVAHLGLVIRNFKALLKIFKRTKNDIYLVPLTIYIIYIGASISSSNFLESIYQWLPLAIGYALEQYDINQTQPTDKLNKYGKYKEIR